MNSNKVHHIPYAKDSSQAGIHNRISLSIFFIFSYVLNEIYSVYFMTIFARDFKARILVEKMPQHLRAT